VVAVLLPARIVTAESIVDVLWGDPPASASGTLPSYVSRLRRQLERVTYWALLVSNFGASGAVATGRFEACVQAAKRGLASDPDGVFGFWGMPARCYLGAGLCLQGDLAAGLPVLAEARRELAVYRELYAEPLLLLAEAVLRHGRGEEPADVAGVMREAIDVATVNGALAVARRVQATSEAMGIDLT
jgi:hypothetical protein